MNPAVTRNIMVDIESFGLRPCGLVVSIGAVCFSSSREDYLANRIFSGKPEDEFHAVLSFDASEKEIRFEKNPSTVAWWQEKQTEAYAHLTSLMRASNLDMKGLMTAFTTWLKPFCDEGCNVVGNSPSFDLVMIENACKVTGVPYPVGHRAEADYRMLTDLCWGPDNKPRPGKHQAHDALFDAKFQAGVYVRALQTLEEWKQHALANGAAPLLP